MILMGLMLIWKWSIKLKERWEKFYPIRLNSKVKIVSNLFTKIFCPGHLFPDKLLWNLQNKQMIQKSHFYAQLYLQLKSNRIVKIENIKNNLRKKKISFYRHNLGVKLPWKVFHKSFKMIFLILLLTE